MSERERTPADADAGLIRHEEELRIEKEMRPIGSVRARKVVEARDVSELVPREIEDADAERVPPLEHDSGEIETLPDGSVSIPIFEEELVVTKRIVVRERVIIRKSTVTEKTRIDAELRRERVEIDADPGIELLEDD